MPCTQGDQDKLFEQAMAQFGQALGRIAAAYEADAERRLDLLQDLQIALWRSFASYDRRCSLKTWVFRIAHNRGTSYILRQKRMALSRLCNIEDYELPTNQPCPESLTDLQNAKAAIHQIIDALHPPDRQIMLLYLEDLSGTEIAQITGVSAGAVATKISRFKALLARKFAFSGDAQ
jgi:RNA polymerase sigma factor (sigma-70 family)